MDNVEIHLGVDSHIIDVAAPPIIMQKEPRTRGDFMRPVEVRKKPVKRPHTVVKSAGMEIRRPATEGDSPWTISKYKGALKRIWLLPIIAKKFENTRFARGACVIISRGMMGCCTLSSTQMRIAAVTSAR